jgi:hypothetical protein
VGRATVRWRAVRTSERRVRRNRDDGASSQPHAAEACRGPTRGARHDALGPDAVQSQSTQQSLDEDANLVWAVERRMRGRDSGTAPDPPPEPPEVLTPRAGRSSSTRR